MSAPVRSRIYLLSKLQNDEDRNGLQRRLGLARSTAYSRAISPRLTHLKSGLRSRYAEARYQARLSLPAQTCDIQQVQGWAVLQLCTQGSAQTGVPAGTSIRPRLHVHTQNIYVLSI